MSVMLFGVFGLGALLLSPLALLLADVERCQPVVRLAWSVMVWLFVRLGLIRVDRGNLPRCRGSIIVANHPSLIDVMLLVVLIPRTLSVAKRETGKNPFMGIVARTSSIMVGADLGDRLAPYLARGWNVLIFPEGTRSPFKDDAPAAAIVEQHPYHRGAAQLALRTGAPLVCVGIRPSRRILAKHQPIWEIGDGPVRYSFAADEPTVWRVRPGESLRGAAIRVTSELERRVGALLA